MYITDYHVTSGEDRDGGQGLECDCLVPQDKVSRDIAKEPTTASIWSKLESL